MKNFMNILLGFCMALADSVPGVSGGTIAFIMGLYDEFISSLYYVVKGDKAQKKSGWLFLTQLLIGWVVGFGASVLVLGALFDRHIYGLCSLFIGLSVCSLPVIIRQEKDSFAGHYLNLIYTFVGIVLVFGVTYFRAAGIYAVNGNVDITKLNPLLIVYIVLAAAVAMSAMVLPGLSGASILLILGLYIPVITGVRELLHGRVAYLPALLLYVCGVVLGVAVSIKLVKAALEKHRSQLMYLIVGLILGSVYSIVQGPTTLDIPQPAMGPGDFNLIYFVCGGVIIWGLEAVKHIVSKSTEALR